MSDAIAIRDQPFVLTQTEKELIVLALNGVTSEHSQRACRTGLEGFFCWLRKHGATRFTKELAQAYRAKLVSRGLSPSTINLRLSAIRKLAREMVDNKRLDVATAAAIQTMPCVKSHGTRVGNWLLRDQANEQGR